MAVLSNRMMEIWALCAERPFTAAEIEDVLEMARYDCTYAVSVLRAEGCLVPDQNIGTNIALRYKANPDRSPADYLIASVFRALPSKTPSQAYISAPLIRNPSLTIDIIHDEEAGNETQTGIPKDC